ncbi:MAG: hypothetical protein HOZ81_18170 [Streptomyces sp.]|nr:hypothetical protein [Streptomyces sp.]
MSALPASLPILVRVPDVPPAGAACAEPAPSSGAEHPAAANAAAVTDAPDQARTRRLDVGTAAEGDLVMAVPFEGEGRARDAWRLASGVCRTGKTRARRAAIRTNTDRTAALADHTAAPGRPHHPPLADHTAASCPTLVDRPHSTYR